MFDVVSKDIDGRRFEIRVLPAKIGRKALVRLTKRIAPVLADLVGNTGDVSVEQIMEAELNLAAAAKTLSSQLNEEDFEYFCNLFAEYSAGEVEAGSGSLVELTKAFDMVFSRRYPTMMKWLWACLEVNFGGFFDGPGSSIGAALAAKAKKGSPSPRE
jgi:hypothetical protein